MNTDTLKKPAGAQLANIENPLERASRFVYGSVRDDYQRFIGGRLLVPASLRRVF